MDERLEKKLKTMLMLFLILIVVAAFSVNSRIKSKPIVFSESLDMVVMQLDGSDVTLEELAFYIAYEEATVQESAVVYNPDNPKEYWNLHTNGTFVKLAAKQAVLDMAIHDFIFYEKAMEQGIALTEEEMTYVENEYHDFCADFETWQWSALGIDETQIAETMECIALANKCQGLLAQEEGVAYTEYNFDGTAYENLAQQYEVKVDEGLWERVPFGKITLAN